MRTQVASRGEIALERSRVMDYISLTKPELTLLSVLTALAGYFMGAGGMLHGIGLVHMLLGTAMIGGGAGALNQYVERHLDRLMKRTENRPLPSGRLAAREALVFGSFLSAGGIIYLTLAVNVLTGFLGAATSVTYLYLYTPMKRITPWATLIGAIPGALPPVMGWTAACGVLSGQALLLFGILFFWQMPHFLSLAWIYRKDYARAGYRLLTVTDTDGGTTGRQVLFHASALLPVSLLLFISGRSGALYGAGAALLGLLFLLCAVRFMTLRTNGAAKTLFIASLVYLPALLLVMVLDTFVR